MAIVPKHPKIVQYTQQEILDKILGRIDEKLEHYNKLVKQCNKLLRDDYCFNFPRYGDTKYSATTMVKHLKLLKTNCKIVHNKAELIPELYAYLKRKQNLLIKDIIQGKPIRTSTNQLTNLAEGMEQECYRELLAFIIKQINFLAMRTDSIIYEGKENLSELIKAEQELYF